jgi:hypothetical protein
MRLLIILFTSIVAVLPGRTAVCDPKNLQGAYASLLSGNTTIGGGLKPVASVGRLVLDGSGALSGTSSTAFTGLLLGNPVMGKYEAGADCTVTWSLQDDSGNWQHFQGTMTEDGRRISFRQTDSGGASNGTMLQTPTTCSSSEFQGRYGLTLSGSTIDVDSGQVSGPVAAKGLIEADGSSGIAFSSDSSAAPVKEGGFEMQDDCWVQLRMQLPAGGNETASQTFRAVLANSGKELLGIQTDPGTAVTIHLVAR